MAIAPRVKWYLDRHDARYEVVSHVHTHSSEETANAAHVDPDRLAKSVLLEDERGYLLAVLPASCRIDLAELGDELGRRFELACEDELTEIFDDCALGAVPPLGFTYGIPTVIDERLLHVSEVYFEGGGHRDLVRMGGLEFAGLVARSPHIILSRPVRTPTAPIRDRDERNERLAADQPHVFSLHQMGESLRRQPEYDKDGHTGMILMKTDELRIVLQVAKAGACIRRHGVHGQTTLYVVSGALDVRRARGLFRVGEGEIVTLPSDEDREILAAGESLFTMAIAPARD